MLQSRKPNIPKEDWFPVLEAMHYELFLCEREGPSPPEEIKKRRAERVLAILNDPRLENCFCFSDAEYEELAKLPYAKLRQRAMRARRIIQDVFLWGRNWEMVMRCSRKSTRWKTYGSRRPKVRLPKPERKRVELHDLERVASKLDLFLGYGTRPTDPPASFFIVKDDVCEILKDSQFRNCYWYRPAIRSDDELYLVVAQARETIRTFLKRRGTDKPAKKKAKKPKRQTAAPKAQPVKTETVSTWPFPR